MNKKTSKTLNDIAPTHKDWLNLMRVYMDELTRNGELFDYLKWEAERMHEREPKITALDHLHHILDELGLKLVVAQG